MSKSNAAVCATLGNAQATAQNVRPTQSTGTTVAAFVIKLDTQPSLAPHSRKAEKVVAKVARSRWGWQRQGEGGGGGVGSGGAPRPDTPPRLLSAGLHQASRQMDTAHSSPCAARPSAQLRARACTLLAAPPNASGCRARQRRGSCHPRAFRAVQHLPPHQNSSTEHRSQHILSPAFTTPPSPPASAPPPARR